MKIRTLMTAQKQKISYVLINLLIATLGFIKSYMTMKYLGFYEVGLLAMVMSIIDFVGMFQMGLLNGGFRMYFVNTPSVNGRINSMLFSYFGILSIILSVLAIIYILINGGIDIQFGMIILGAIVGIISLVKNWISNLLIANQKLEILNRINVWSTLLSFTFIAFVPYFGLLGSVLLIVSQPILFTLSALWSNPELRPTSLFYKKSLLRKLMFFGFIPFLAGILVKIDDQIERWGIINFLGVEELGKYNLVFIYCSLFMLVPLSLNSIFLPKAMLIYKAGNLNEFKLLLKRYILSLFVYTVCAIVLTILLFPYLINFFLPKYNVGVPFVWYIMPYLGAQMMIMPLDFIYTITARYKVMFFSYTAAVLIFIILVLSLKYFPNIKLQYFAISKSFDGLIFVSISYLGYYFILRKNIFK